MKKNQPDLMKATQLGNGWELQEWEGPGALMYTPPAETEHGKVYIRTITQYTTENTETGQLIRTEVVRDTEVEL